MMSHRKGSGKNGTCLTVLFLTITEKQRIRCRIVMSQMTCLADKMTGSIVCWTDGGYGHVGYVTQVDQDGQIQILESNYQGQQQINNYRGWFDPQNSTTPGSVSYIYPGA